MTRWSANHPLFATALGTALALALAATFGVADIVGLHQVARAALHVHWVWIAIAVGAQLVSIPAYAVAYRELVGRTTGDRLPLRLIPELVIIGFGPFALTGGFDLDRRVLERVGQKREVAVTTVLDAGGVEFRAPRRLRTAWELDLPDKHPAAPPRPGHTQRSAA